MTPEFKPSTPTNQEIQSFQSTLLAWHDEHGRHDLPWQLNQTPYTVWLSEIMLQQTQVSTVIPYFHQFIDRFPNIETLAQATEDAVLHLWQGLGYYTRARRLHHTAKIIHQQYADEFPQSLQELCQLPGIGRSTAGAILAMGWQQKGTILDGNVKRVLCRLWGIRGDLSKASTNHLLWDMAEQLTPNARVAQYTQAMMDFGATYCRKHTPKCLAGCPFKKSCAAFTHDQVSTLPNTQTKKQRKRTVEAIHFAILLYQGHVLLQQRPTSGIWGALWAFPNVMPLSITLWCQQQSITIKKQQTLPPIKHLLTHRELHIQSTCIEISHDKNLSFQNQLWYNLKQGLSVGVPKPVSKLLSHVGAAYE